VGVQNPDWRLQVIADEPDWLLQIAVVRDDDCQVVPRTEAVDQEVAREVDI
jgi:hypothetical protein